MYQYDLYKQDGTIERIGTFKDELPFGDTDAGKGLYSYLNCSMIEMIPRDYFKDDLLNLNDKRVKSVVAYGDEEGRFNGDNQTNPHFRVIQSPMGAFDVVGDIIVVTEFA